MIKKISFCIPILLILFFTCSWNNPYLTEYLNNLPDKSLGGGGGGAFQLSSITNINVIIDDESTATSATVTFNTNADATHDITYHVLGSGTDFVDVSNIVTSNHTNQLTGLTPYTTYVFTITARDSLSNIVSSADQYFYTTVDEDGPTGGWYKSFLEPFTSTPVYDPGSTCYYSSVLYDENHFNNNISDFVTGSSGDTYQVLPYFKMWVGDGTNTDFAYSDDGINWVRPLSSGQDIVAAYHPTVIYSAAGFPGESKKNPSAIYRMWNWVANAPTLTYYESEDGVNFTNYADIFIDNTLANVSTGLIVYSISILYRPSLSPRYEGWIDNNGLLYSITSDDGLVWQKKQPVNRITHTGKDGSTPGDFYTGGWSSIIFRNSKYTMWYSSGVTGIENSNYNRAISYAESSDGLNWELVDIIPSMGINAAPAGIKSNGILRTDDGNTWRTNRTYDPSVIYSPNKFVTSDGVLHGEYIDFKMWFTGDGPAGRRIFYASFNEP